MIYEASNYMEGVEDHFQANQLLFISVYQCNVSLRSQKYHHNHFSSYVKLLNIELKGNLGYQNSTSIVGL